MIDADADQPPREVALPHCGHDRIRREAATDRDGARLSPHRVLAVDENDELLDRAAEPRADYGPQQDFAGMILEQLATAGVQQAHKEDRIDFAASSARCPVRIWWRPRARRATPASTS